VAPTLDASTPAVVFLDTAATVSLVTASFTPPLNSIVVAHVVSADGAQTHTGVTGLTFTSRLNVGSASASTRNSLWTAVGAGSAVTVTAAFGGTGTHRMLAVKVWTSAQLAGTPATHSLVFAGSAPSDAITTAAAGSVVDWSGGDWAQITGARTYRSSAVEDGYHTSAGQYTGYAAHQAAASAGSQTYGQTAPTGQTSTLVSVEVQASGGAPALPPMLTMQTRRAY
jgi:hypothetical protein